jgi:hypothetical protein
MPTDSPSSDAAYDDSPPAIAHVTIENENRPDDCALFPRAAPESERLTTWIAATEHDVVDLDDRR